MGAGVTLILALAEEAGEAGEHVKVNLKDFLGPFRKML